MRTPPRLLEDGADPFEAELLRSARGDGASARRERTLAALGIAGTTLAGAGLATAQAALGSAKALTALKVGVLLSVAAIGSATTVALVERHARHVATPTSAMAASDANAASRAPFAASEARSPTLVPSAPAAPDRPAAAVAKSTRPLPLVRPPEAVRPSTKPLAAADPLSEEVSLLDEARRQLVNHDGPAAMRAASTYLTRFPAGRLADEAQVLRVDAAFLIGGRSASAPLAEAFLREHPDSPHAPAVRELLRSAASAVIK